MERISQVLYFTSLIQFENTDNAFTHSKDSGHQLITKNGKVLVDEDSKSSTFRNEMFRNKIGR